jgi:hypothetical protein
MLKPKKEYGIMAFPKFFSDIINVQRKKDSALGGAVQYCR